MTPLTLRLIAAVQLGYFTLAHEATRQAPMNELELFGLLTTLAFVLLEFLEGLKWAWTSSSGWRASASKWWAGALKRLRRRPGR